MDTLDSAQARLQRMKQEPIVTLKTGVSIDIPSSTGTYSGGVFTLELPPIQSPNLDSNPFRAHYAGYIFKLGDGLINSSWGWRYVMVISGCLCYFDDARDKNPKVLINLFNASVSYHEPIRGKNNVFLLMSPSSRPVYFSLPTAQSCIAWVTLIMYNGATLSGNYQPSLTSLPTMTYVSSLPSPPYLYYFPVKNSIPSSIAPPVDQLSALCYLREESKCALSDALDIRYTLRDKIPNLLSGEIFTSRTSCSIEDVLANLLMAGVPSGSLIGCEGASIIGLVESARLFVNKHHKAAGIMLTRAETDGTVECRKGMIYDDENEDVEAKEGDTFMLLPRLSFSSVAAISIPYNSLKTSINPQNISNGVGTNKDQVKKLRVGHNSYPISISNLNSAEVKRMIDFYTLKAKSLRNNFPTASKSHQHSSIYAQSSSISDGINNQLFSENTIDNQSNLYVNHLVEFAVACCEPDASAGTHVMIAVFFVSVVVCSLHYYSDKMINMYLASFVNSILMPLFSGFSFEYTLFEGLQVGLNALSYIASGVNLVPLVLLSVLLAIAAFTAPIIAGKRRTKVRRAVIDLLSSNGTGPCAPFTNTKSKNGDSSLRYSNNQSDASSSYIPHLSVIPQLILNSNPVGMNNTTAIKAGKNDFKSYEPIIRMDIDIPSSSPNLLLKTFLSESQQINMSPASQEVRAWKITSRQRLVNQGVNRNSSPSLLNREQEAGVFFVSPVSSGMGDSITPGLSIYEVIYPCGERNYDESDTIVGEGNNLHKNPENSSFNGKRCSKDQCTCKQRHFRLRFVADVESSQQRQQQLMLSKNQNFSPISGAIPCALVLETELELFDVFYGDYIDNSDVNYNNRASNRSHSRISTSSSHLLKPPVPPTLKMEIGAALRLPRYPSWTLFNICGAPSDANILNGIKNRLQQSSNTASSSQNNQFSSNLNSFVTKELEMLITSPRTVCTSAYHNNVSINPANGHSNSNLCHNNSMRNAKNDVYSSSDVSSPKSNAKGNRQFLNNNIQTNFNPNTLKSIKSYIIAVGSVISIPNCTSFEEATEKSCNNNHNIKSSNHLEVNATDKFNSGARSRNLSSATVIVHEHIPHPHYGKNSAYTTPESTRPPYKSVNSIQVSNERLNRISNVIARWVGLSKISSSSIRFIGDEAILGQDLSCQAKIPIVSMLGTIINASRAVTSCGSFSRVLYEEFSFLSPNVIDYKHEIEEILSDSNNLQNKCIESCNVILNDKNHIFPLDLSDGHNTHPNKRANLLTPPRSPLLKSLASPFSNGDQITSYLQTNLVRRAHHIQVSTSSHLDSPVYPNKSISNVSPYHDDRISQLNNVNQSRNEECDIDVISIEEYHSLKKERDKKFKISNQCSNATNNSSSNKLAPALKDFSLALQGLVSQKSDLASSPNSNILQSEKLLFFNPWITPAINFFFNEDMHTNSWFARDGRSMRIQDPNVTLRLQQLYRSAVSGAASTLAAGKSIVDVSLPPETLEPRTSMQRMFDIWGYAPALLARAATGRSDIRDAANSGWFDTNTGPLISSEDRFKWVAVYAVASLCRQANVLKPFNPQTGETCCGVYADGSVAFTEHTHHKPLRSHFLVDGPSLSKQVGRGEKENGDGNSLIVEGTAKKAFWMAGHVDVGGAFSANSAFATQEGQVNVCFPSHISHPVIQRRSERINSAKHGFFDALAEVNEGLASTSGIPSDAVADKPCGCCITIKNPPAKIDGIIFGSRSFDWEGDLVVDDNCHDLICVIKFPCPELSRLCGDGGGIFGKKPANGPEAARAAANRVNWHGALPPPKDFFLSPIKRKSTGQVISWICGSWFGDVFIDGQKYWSAHEPLFCPVSTFGADICYLDRLVNDLPPQFISPPRNGSSSPPRFRSSRQTHASSKGFHANNQIGGGGRTHAFGVHVNHKNLQSSDINSSVFEKNAYKPGVLPSDTRFRYDILFANQASEISLNSPNPNEPEAQDALRTSKTWKLAVEAEARRARGWRKE